MKTKEGMSNNRVSEEEVLAEDFLHFILCTTWLFVWTKPVLNRLNTSWKHYFDDTVPTRKVTSKKGLKKCRVMEKPEQRRGCWGCLVGVGRGSCNRWQIVKGPFVRSAICRGSCLSLHLPKISSEVACEENSIPTRRKVWVWTPEPTIYCTGKSGNIT